MSFGKWSIDGAVYLERGTHGSTRGLCKPTAEMRKGGTLLLDIICCISGRFVAFEVKTASGKLTKLQEITIQKIKDAKGNAYKVQSVEDVKTILESLEGCPHEHKNERVR